LNLRAFRSDSLLLTAAVVWGFAFVAQRAGMSYVGPFTFNAVRFALGAGTLAPLLPGARRRDPAARPGPHSRRSLQLGFALLGVTLFAGASLQQTGIVYTSAGKAGFITGLYVVIVPLIGFFLGRRPDFGAWTGAALAAMGLYLLTVTGRFEVALGDSLVLGSAFFFAVHVLMVDRLSRRIHPIRLAFVQFATCAALSSIAAFALEEPSIEGIRRAAYPILYAGVLSVGVAYTLQLVAQREAPPGHAAIILSTEAVFAALGGSLLLGETLSSRGLAGCSLMLAGAIVSKLGAAPAASKAGASR